MVDTNLANIKSFFSIHGDILNAHFAELSVTVANELKVPGYVRGSVSPTPAQYFPPDEPLPNFVKCLYRIYVEMFNLSEGNPISRPFLLQHAASHVLQYYEEGKKQASFRRIPTKILEDCYGTILVARDDGVLGYLQKAAEQKISQVQRQQVPVMVG